ncbi:hypothetical protein F5880DRAFT_1512838, partial [Lentinula raphanica]
MVLLFALSRHCRSGINLKNSFAILLILGLVSLACASSIKACGNTEVNPSQQKSAASASHGEGQLIIYESVKEEDAMIYSDESAVVSKFFALAEMSMPPTLDERSVPKRRKGYGIGFWLVLENGASGLIAKVRAHGLPKSETNGKTEEDLLWELRLADFPDTYIYIGTGVLRRRNTLKMAEELKRVAGYLIAHFYKKVPALRFGGYELP